MILVMKKLEKIYLKVVKVINKYSNAIKIYCKLHIFYEFKIKKIFFLRIKKISENTR